MYKSGAHKANKYHNHFIRLIKNDFYKSVIWSFSLNNEEKEQENLADDYEQELSASIWSDFIEIFKPFSAFQICISIILFYGC